MKYWSVKVAGLSSKYASLSASCPDNSQKYDVVLFALTEPMNATTRVGMLMEIGLTIARSDQQDQREKSELLVEAELVLATYPS